MHMFTTEKLVKQNVNKVQNPHKILLNIFICFIVSTFNIEKKKKLMEDLTECVCVYAYIYISLSDILFNEIS